jgi:hypothetical protein
MWLVYLVPISKVENSAQVLSCQLKFVHASKLVFFSGGVEK